MLSNVVTVWPPNQSAELIHFSEAISPTLGVRIPYSAPNTQSSSTIGTKTRFPTWASAITESLADLHLPAWWSGVKVLGVSGEVLMRLVTSDATIIDEWTQMGGVWTHLRWPIPAAMGKALGLTLRVESIDPAVRMGMITCFHELPLMKPRDRYIFVDEQGATVRTWDGIRHVVDDPIPRTLHWVVPPTAVLNVWKGDSVQSTESVLWTPTRDAKLFH